MRAALLSDIHGQHGASHDYMAAWSAILHERGYEVQPWFLDTLCPAAYQANPFDKQTTHHHFVQDGGINSAVRVLKALLADNCFDLLLGFSLGGFLACQVRACLPSGASLICISATRLRLNSGRLPGECPVHMVFGEDDPFRPEPIPVLGGIQHHYLIAHAGHEIYLEPERCRFVLDAMHPAELDTSK